MQGIPNRGIKMFGFLAALGSAALEALGSTAATVGEGAALAGEGASLAAGGAAGGTAGIAAGSVAAAADSALASAGNLGEAAAGEGAGLLNGPKDFFAQAWQNTKDDLGNAWDDVAIKNPDGSVNGWKTAGNLGYKTAKGLVMGLGNAALSGSGGQKTAANSSNAEKALQENQTAAENGLKSFQTGNPAEEQLKNLMSKMQQI